MTAHPEQYQYDIFISYAHEDADWVKKHLYSPLSQCCNESGDPLRIFLDEEEILPGDKWLNLLVDSIHNSRFHMPVYSSTYFKKPMCELEFERFIFEDRRGERLFPLLLEAEAEAQIPDSLQNIQSLPVYDTENWLEQLIHALKIVQPDTEPPAPTAKDLLAKAGNRHALIIGISTYDDPSIPNLQYAARDAHMMAELLKATGGFKKENVSLLINQEATAQNIKLRLHNLRETAPDDLVLIYYAGHGCPEEYTTGIGADTKLSWKYLVPHDGDRKALMVTAIKLDALHDFFKLYNSNQLVVLLDSCYSGQSRSFSEVSARGAITDATLEDLTDTGRVILTACEAGELAYENHDLGHGVFTHYLLEGLNGAADSDGRGVVDIPNLYAYLQKHIPVEAKRQGGSQHPVLKGENDLRVPLTFPGAVTISLPDLEKTVTPPLAVPDDIPPAPPPPATDGQFFELAQSHADRGDYEDAIDILQDHLPRRGPARIKMLCTLGLYTYRLGHFDAARDRYEQALHEDVTEVDARGHDGYGDVLQHLGEYEEALEAYGNAVELGGNRSGYGRLAMALKQMVRTQPDASELHLLLARCYAAQNKNQEALAYLKQTCGIWPETDLDILAKRLDENPEFQGLKETAEYQKLHTTLTSRREKQIEFEKKLRQATEVLEQSNLGLAAQILNDVLSLLPNASQKPEIFERLATQQQRATDLLHDTQEKFDQGEYQIAQKILCESLEIDRSNPKALALADEITTVLEKEKKVSQLLQEVQEHRKNGDLSTASQNLNTARELALGQADWLQEIDRLDAEIQAMEAHLRQERIRIRQEEEQRQREEAFSNLLLQTDNHLKQKNLDAASQSIKKASEIFPDHPDLAGRKGLLNQLIEEDRRAKIRALIAEARALEETKSYLEAIDKLEEANRLGPGRWDVQEVYTRIKAICNQIAEIKQYVKQADMYADQNLWDLAETTILKARDLAPEDPEIFEKHMSIINRKKAATNNTTDEEQEVYQQRIIEKEKEAAANRATILFDAISRFQDREQEQTEQKEKPPSPESSERQLIKFRKTMSVGDVRQLMGKKLHRWGFRTSSGAVAIQPIYEEVRDFSEGLAAVKRNGKWGYINTEGKVVIKYQFKNADSFAEGKAYVKIGLKKGYINKRGNPAR